MPTENELKYVILLDCEDSIKGIADSVQTICQGYLVASRGVSMRVRRVEGVQHYLTFKYTTKSRIIEIEKKINQRDFNDLWDVAMNKLEKTRYKIDGWEIDFFKDHHDHTYFAMAEHEMPEGQKKPHYYPDWFNKFVVFPVSYGDTRFSSKLLADVRHAKSLYKSILSENIAI